MEYMEFIKNKSQFLKGVGISKIDIPDYLFDFQKALVEWSLESGRSAIFSDCGTGKTPMQLVWADNIIKNTNKPVLVLTPLAVAFQTVDEAVNKFDINAAVNMDGVINETKIYVTNYEKLHKFNSNDFSGIVCDESSCIKNFNGVRKSAITDFMKKVQYRLLCTATAAPNDYMELGTSSEALGYLGYMDMLTMFFKNNEDSISPAFIGSQWRLKRHAETDFWRWMSSWCRALRKPSDLGFDDGDFILPDLIENELTVKSPLRSGYLFNTIAKTLSQQREDNKLTIEKRCELAGERLANHKSGIAWCNLNAEGDLLAKIIPGAVQVSGSDKDQKKIEIFNDFKSGKIRVLVTKPKIAAFGLNWQHCNNMTYFTNHSFEQCYQAIRRCWRFGQKNPVYVDFITTDSQVNVYNNLQRKAKACAEMFDKIVDEMNNVLNVNRMEEFKQKAEIPTWM